MEQPTSTFAKDYEPDDKVVEKLFPLELVDFFPNGSYSLYNWELFFHAPLLIACRLMKDQKFEEARQWFHYIFDPTCGTDPEADSSSVDAIRGFAKEVLGVVGVSDPQDLRAARFWKIQPFFLNFFGQVTLEEMMRMLSYKGENPEGKNWKQLIEAEIERWRKDPFKPHQVARLRWSAYQKTVVMKYLDNLIAWGDRLFRQDTVESINEATQLYVLAARILGPRPTEVYPRVAAKAKTFNDLESLLDKFSNALVQTENLLAAPPAGLSVTSASGTESPIAAVETGEGLRATWSWLPTGALYFCIPKNDQLLSYWDTVEDRLFKIRHCMNIEGIERQLPLFAPPINPALLVKAAAAGVDIGSVLQDLSAPLPWYRFEVMLQRAKDLCNDVKSLGAELLAAIEKGDSERLALLRSEQEIQFLSERVRGIKEQQIKDAEYALTALNFAKEIARQRFAFYDDRPFMNLLEAGSLALQGVSLLTYIIGALLEPAAAVSYAIPKVAAGTAGLGPLTKIESGGDHAGHASRATAQGFKDFAEIASRGASMMATLGSFTQRSDEWGLQARIAEQDQNQIGQQIEAAKVKKAIAEKELSNHDAQIDNLKTVDAFMRDKFSNEELYGWMKGQISSLYFQSYNLAYDIAKRAERCFRFELGLEDSNFIQFGYWDSLRKGLLSGERLYHDIKRMEIAYLEQHKRECEITKHISLALLDPVALLKLKQTGQCFVNLKEELFDLDYPGHYMRRIKSVSVTIPCVTGPYASVNCTLILLKNSVRKNTRPGTQYVRNHDDKDLPLDDDRFIDNLGAIQSIVTSSAQNDSGLFEVNLHDERYLPFEGAGAISSWRIELPKECNQFDFNTISDVVLHLRYTARDGGGILKAAAMKEIVKTSPKTGIIRLFSARHEFPTEWQRLLYPTGGDDQELKLDLSEDRFPFSAQGKCITVNAIELFARCKDQTPYSAQLTTPSGKPVNDDDIKSDQAFGQIHHGRKMSVSEVIASPSPAPWGLKFKKKAARDFKSLAADDVEDIILVLEYSFQL